MFCANCGNEINNDAKFCHNCGNEMPLLKETPWNDFSLRETNSYMIQNISNNEIENASEIIEEPMGTPMLRRSKKNKKKNKVNDTTIQKISTTDSSGNIINNITLVNSKSLKSKWIAFFLCLFLGGLGFHRFYVGKYWTGVLYLFTLGLCGIGWIIDLVAILLGGFKDCYGNLL